MTLAEKLERMHLILWMGTQILGASVLSHFNMISIYKGEIVCTLWGVYEPRAKFPWKYQIYKNEYIVFIIILNVQRNGAWNTFLTLLTIPHPLQWCFRRRSILNFSSQTIQWVILSPFSSSGARSKRAQFPLIDCINK